MTIEEMKAELKIMDEQAKEIADKRTALRQQIADSQAVFTVGARVTYQGANCVWELKAVRPGWYENEPEYIGSKIKKDGTPGALQSRIYVPYGKQLLAA